MLSVKFTMENKENKANWIIVYLPYIYRLAPRYVVLPNDSNHSMDCSEIEFIGSLAQPFSKANNNAHCIGAGSIKTNKSKSEVCRLKGAQRPAAFAIVCFCFCEFCTVSYSGSCGEQVTEFTQSMLVFALPLR